MQVRRWLLIGEIACLFVCSLRSVQAQTRVEERQQTNRQIKCFIQTERPKWQPNEPAVVLGTIQNTAGRPIRVAAEPVLYLTSKTSHADRDRYWSPIDVLHNAPLSTDRNLIGSGGEAEAIKTRAIDLEFKTGGRIEFKIDARNPHWAREISSVWPSQKLFSVVEPGVYSLQLVLQTKQGQCASAAVSIVVAPATPKK